MSQEPVTVEIKRVGDVHVELPAYMTPGAAGMDVRAALQLPIDVAPGARTLVPCGFALAIPRGYEAQIRPRSGLAARNGLTVLNTPGTVDADYRGEVKVILVNLGNEPFSVTRGMRVAQMVIAPVVQATVEHVDELPGSVRGEGGFGSTGTG